MSSVENFKKLQDFEALVDKYTKTTPKTRKAKDKQLEDIERGMNEIKGKLSGVAIRSYNDLIDKLDRYEQSEQFKKAYEGKVVPRHQLDKLEEKREEQKEEMKEEEPPMREEEMSGISEIEEETPDTQEVEVSELEEDSSPPGAKLVDDDEGSETTMGGDTPRMPMDEEEEEAKEEVREEEVREDEGISPEMEEFHNQIRRDERERVIAEFNITEDTEGKIDIPKERLGTEGKSVKVLNEDIKYFLKRFPDMLKLERDVYNKANKKDKKLLIDIHRRIQAKLSPKANESSKRIGIILDADSYIDDKINEILARKTLEGLTPANLVDITSEPKSKGKDVGSYTLTQVGGRDVVQNAPVYRAIPSTSEEALKKPSDKNARIDQSTINKNSGKTKVDIAKMELVDNPFIRRTRPDRFNIIL